MLRSYAPDLEANFLVERFNGGQYEFDVLQLRAADRLRPAPGSPARSRLLPTSTSARRARGPSRWPAGTATASSWT